MAASWKTLRVFISSTFRDMQAERDHLLRFVFPKLREELLKHRLHLIDVDLRWGVTSDQDAVSICREVIDECQPRFMGILGGRYGWIPEGHEHSITADEVRYGVLEREAELWGNAFFYFRDKQATASIVEETPGDFREPEDSESAGKLSDLKQSIVNAGLPAFTYDARWDGLQKRLTGLEAFGDHLYAYLLKNIQDDPEMADHFASATGTPVDEFAEEREAMEAFIEDRTERYVVGSRQELLDKMTAFASANSEQNILVIEGEPGSGKSSLLGKFCQLPASLRQGVLISHFVGASAGSTNLRRTLRRLCHELAAVSGNTDLVPEDIRELIDLFRKLLGEAAARQRVVMVIDAINQFDAAEGSHDMSWLPLQLPPNIRIIVSSLEHPALEALRRRGEPVRVETLALLSGEDAFEIIDAFLQRYSKRLSPEQIAALLAKPESHLPLYLLTALEELRTLGTYEEITARIRELPGEAKPLFGWILKHRLSNDPGFRNAKDQPCGAALVAKFASYLGVSRHGLSQEELIGLLDPGDPRGNVAALLRLLRPYLMRRGELLDFFHGQLREAVEIEYLDEPEKRLEAHRFLSTYFHDAADPNCEGRWKGTSAHALSELPYHQIRAEAWPELVSTLENIFFLEAKVTYGMTFDLVLDFSDAVECLQPEHPQCRNLKLLLEALRRDLQFIAHHAHDYPQALFQSLWNSCWWHDCPEAAFYYEVPNGGWKQSPPWESGGTDRLSTLLEHWRTGRETAHPCFFWLRSARPPLVPLGSGQLAIFRGHTSYVSCVAFSPDGRRMVSGSEDKTLRIWDLATGRELAMLPGHEGGIATVAFSPDGSSVLSGAKDNTIRLWDTNSAREVVNMGGHSFYGRGFGGLMPAFPHVAAFSADGRQIVSGGSDKMAILWDVESGQKLANFEEHEDTVTSVAFSPDRRHILTGVNNGAVRIWDAQTKCELSRLQMDVEQQEIAHCVAFSLDGSKVLSGWAYDINFWDIASGSLIHKFKTDHGITRCMVFSPDGRRMLTGAEDCTVRLWNLETGCELAVFRGHSDYVNAVAFSPDGRRAISGANDKTLRVWDLENYRDVILQGHRSEITCLEFSNNGSRLISGGNDFTTRVWHVNSGRELAVLRGHEGCISSVALSPSGRHAVNGAADNTLRLWEVASGQELAVLRGHEKTPLGVCFSPDGARVLSWSLDNTARLWDAGNGRVLAVLRGHESSVRCAVFSPDGQQIVSGSGDVLKRVFDITGDATDNSVRIWDTASGCELAVLRRPESAVWSRTNKSAVLSVAFSPDGYRIVSGSGHEFSYLELCDNGVRLWDPVSRRELAVLRGHNTGVTRVAFSSDGQRILSTDYSRRTLIWNANTGVCLSTTPADNQITLDLIANSTIWHASVEDGETLIRSQPGAQPEGRLPEALSEVKTSSGKIWAAFSGSHLILMRLEGGNREIDAIPTDEPENDDESISNRGIALLTKGPARVQFWTNSLGMKFVPAGTDGVLFCVWHVRVRDYLAFVTETGQEWPRLFLQTDIEPAVNVSWNDAHAFCAWLTRKELAEGILGAKQIYRLPSDAEWSVAVGLEDEGTGMPKDKDGRIEGVYPWGTKWPPPDDAGNYDKALTPHGYAKTSPVGSFAANRYGLYDMGGNVWQWCEDKYGNVNEADERVLRGNSWCGCDAESLRSSFRNWASADNRAGACGFRVVLAVPPFDR